MTRSGVIPFGGETDIAGALAEAGVGEIRSGGRALAARTTDLPAEMTKAPTGAAFTGAGFQLTKQTEGWSWSAGGALGAALGGLT